MPLGLSFADFAWSLRGTPFWSSIVVVVAVFGVSGSAGAMEKRAALKVAMRIGFSGFGFGVLLG